MGRGILLLLWLVLLLPHHFLLTLLQSHLPLHFILLLLCELLLLFRVTCVLIIIHLIVAFWDNSHLLLLSDSKVQILCLPNVAVKPFNFEFVCVDL